MEKEIFYAIFVLLFVACVSIASARNCNVCQFEKKFPNEGKRCYTWPSGTKRPETTPFNVESSTSSGETTPFVESSTSSGVSTSSSNMADCFLQSEKAVILNGSSLVNEDCTRKFTCTNGILDVNEGYSCGYDAVCETRNSTHKCYCNSTYYGNGEICSQYYTNCLDVFNNGITVNGIYTIKPTNLNGLTFEVYCDMSDGGGWTVFQRRVNGSVNFYRDWASYKQGFGELGHEFWLGNDKLHSLTNQEDNQLRIDLVNDNGDPFYANYDGFRINDESDNYRLSQIGSYSGNAGNALQYDLYSPFTTLDRDNDQELFFNCADERRGGWWYRVCTRANLNGDYNEPNANYYSIYWQGLSGNSLFNIKYTEMKIRPI